MMRITTILFTTLLLYLASVSAATLIDSEDFEGYTVSSSSSIAQLASDSSGEWNCTTPAQYPNCRVNQGAGGSPNTLIKIEQSGANEYLTLIATNHSAAPLNYYQTFVSWNHTDVSAIGTGESIYTFKYRFRMNNNMNWFNDTNNAEGYFSLWRGQILTMQGTGQSWNGIGGCEYFETGCDTPTEFGKMRSVFDSGDGMFNLLGTLTNHTAHDNCTITEDQWHDIQVEETFNDTDHIRKRVWVDQKLCADLSFSYNQLSSLVPFQMMNFYNHYEFSVSYDDIEIYEGAVAFYECDDGADNDGDGATDYPDDPSCTSTTDDSEAPFDYFECNDGVDNDLDGYTDYPNDPSCTSTTDNTEAPADASIQYETECLASEDCLFADQFPYSDNLSNHGWEGDASVSATEILFAGRRLFLNNLGVDNFSFWHNITNDNNYNDVRAEYEMFFDIDNQNDGATYNYYVVFKDSDANELLRLRYDLTNYATEPYMFVEVYYYNGTGYEYLVYSTPGLDALSQTKYRVDFDQILKTFTLEYYEGSWYSALGDFSWTNVMAGDLDSIYIEQGNYSSLAWGVWLDNILLSGQREDVTSVCDDWSLPYYLVETFNGYLSDCDWLTSHMIFAGGQLEVTDDIGYYYAQKTTDLAEEQHTQYVTFSADIKVINVTVIGSTISFRLYDSDEFNFVTIYFRDSGDYLWYNDGGTGKTATSIVLNQSYNYKAVVDFDNDEYDLYFNGSKVVDGSKFSNKFVNVIDLQTFKFTSNDANFVIDNVKIYACDEDGTPLLPDEALEYMVKNETVMCGLIYKDPPSCVDDSDCPTGNCLVTHKCSTFDYNYCDEHNMVRGNKCFLGAITDCILSSTGDVILDNFFLFLILLVLLLGAVYLAVAMKSK